MAKKKGKSCKVYLGGSSASILAMGTWEMPGITSDQLDETVFGDNWKHFLFGLKDGGEVSFNGFFDPADTTGQEALRQKHVNQVDITDLRLYIDNTSYFEPCRTTGYFSPNSTTGNDTELSKVNITTVRVGADKAGLLTIGFTGKVSGCMVLV